MSDDVIIDDEDWSDKNDVASEIEEDKKQRKELSRERMETKLSQVVQIEV